MAQIKNDNILARAPKPIDERSGLGLVNGIWKTFTSVAQALADPDVIRYRYESMTLPINDGINPMVEYWFSGGIDNSNFVVKTIDLTGYVPYTGATGDVTLGSHNITAGSFIKTGGASDQFLKADGSVDSTNYASVSALNAGLQLKANVSGQVFTGNISAPNLSGTNTGDQDLSGYQLLTQKNQANGYAGLDSGAKILTSQLPDSILGALIYQGVWNAATNTPTLVNPPASSTKGYFYVTDVAGTQFGLTFAVGDWIVSNGAAWQKVDNTDAVVSVFGRIGNVLANESDYSAYYPVLTGSYVNPSWITSLPYSKITGAPVSVTTMGVIGGASNANGATISGTTLTLQPASASFGGLVTTSAQTFAGIKTFSNNVNVNGNIAATEIFGNTLKTYNSLKFDAANHGGFEGVLSSSQLTAARSWILPNKSGTVALTSDIPSLANYVTTNTNQTTGLTGNKTWDGSQIFSVRTTHNAGWTTNNASNTVNNGSIYYPTGTGGVNLDVEGSGTTNTSVSLPKDKTGVIALTSDLATGQTIGANITGNAATATSWGTRTADLSSFASSISSAPAIEAVTGVVKLATAEQYRVWQGSPSGGETLQSVTERGRTITVNNTGISRVLNFENSEEANADNGTSIFFRGFYDQSLITSYNNPTQATGGFLSLQTYSSNGVLNSGITLNNTGNIGIGTVTPTAKLDVNGTGNFSGGVGFDRANISLSAVTRYKTGGVDDWFIGTNPLGSGDSDYNIYSYGTNTVIFKLAKNTGNAFFSGSVTALTFNGNATSADTWNEYESGESAGSAYIMTTMGGIDKWHYRSLANFKTDLGIPGARTLKDFYTTVSNVGDPTVYTNLYTYVLPTGILNNIGDKIHVTFAGAFGSSSNAKTLKLNFGNVAMDLQPSTTVSDSYWQATGLIMRVTNTSCRMTFSLGGTMGNNSTISDAGVNFSVNNNIILSGKSNGSGDIVVGIGSISFEPASV